MAGESKKGGKGYKRFLPLLLIGGGAALAIWGRQWFEQAIDQFLDGIGFKVRGVKLKFRNVSTIDITLQSTITNKNAFGGTATGLDARLRFGRSGPVLALLSLPAPIQIPANGSVDADIKTSVNLFTLGASVQEIVSQITSGNLKKLWLEGQLKTNIVVLPISTEVSLFTE